MKRSRLIHSNSFRTGGEELSPRRALALVCMILLIAVSAAHGGETRLTLVYTNSLNGYLDYCHCKGNPRGGLVKRATEMKKIRGSFKNVLLVETGDIFPFEPDPLLNEYIVKAYRHIGYDAVQPGDQEFAAGVEGLMRFRADLPFICGNLLVKQGGRWERPFAGSRVIERGGVKIGLIGSMSPGAFKYYTKNIRDSIKITDQADAIRADIARAKQQGAEFIILLSHSGYEDDLELQKKLKDVGIIAGGHSQTLLAEPVKPGECVIVQAGADGARIGILELTLRGGRAASYRNSFRLPDEFQPADDPYIRQLINEYRKKSLEQHENLRFR